MPVSRNGLCPDLGSYIHYGVNDPKQITKMADTPGMTVIIRHHRNLGRAESLTLGSMNLRRFGLLTAMRRFEVREYRTSGSTPGTKHQVLGRRAPGAGVLVVREGTGWVMGQDGSREAISAKSVVMWDTGEWVEYGSEDGLRAEEFWAVQEPEGAAEARLSAAFGQAGN
jgi:hypothetical protein